MININDRNNYLEIIDSREIDNVRTSFYPKKDTFFNVFYLPVEEYEEVESGAPRGGEGIEEPIEVEAGAGRGEEDLGDSIDTSVPDPIIIGNIEIKKTFGSFVINVEDFVNRNVLINDRVETFEKCVDFLTLNTAV